MQALLIISQHHEVKSKLAVEMKAQILAFIRGESGSWFGTPKTGPVGQEQTQLETGYTPHSTSRQIYSFLFLKRLFSKYPENKEYFHKRKGELMERGRSKENDLWTPRGAEQGKWTRQKILRACPQRTRKKWPNDENCGRRWCPGSILSKQGSSELRSSQEGSLDWIGGCAHDLLEMTELGHL